MHELERACEWFRPFHGVRGVLVREGAEEVFGGAIGPYGCIGGATSYLAFIGDDAADNTPAKLGYLGEGLILEATSHGLSTCWVGGLFRRDRASERLELQRNERVYGVSPVGHASKSRSLFERSISLVVRSRRRKPCEQIAEGFPGGEWPDWARQGIEAARLAPSAVNRQPWRFRNGPQGVVVSVDSPREALVAVPKALDCGIAMLHFELGARVAGAEGRWVFLEAPDVARFEIRRA